jgi:hypothetical protein
MCHVGYLPKDRMDGAFDYNNVVMKVTELAEMSEDPAIRAMHHRHGGLAWADVMQNETVDASKWRGQQ